MEPKKTPTRTVLLMGVFETTGDVLLLQLIFVVASLPVVTLLPAALALQRSLGDVLLESRTHPARLYWENFKWALSRSWKIAVLPPLFTVLAAASILFWLAAGGPLGTVALCILIPLFGVVVAGYIAVLAAVLQTTGVAPTAANGGIAGPREWLRRALALAPGRSLQLALSVVIMATWLLLLTKLPTLILVGTGLVPAGLAWWVAAPWVQHRRAELANS
jgi:hypothetical protein